MIFRFNRIFAQKRPTKEKILGVVSPAFPLFPSLNPFHTHLKTTPEKIQRTLTESAALHLAVEEENGDGLENGCRENGVQENGARENDGRENDVPENDGRENDVLENGGRENDVLENDSRENDVLENDGRENGGQENGGREIGGRENGGRENDGREHEKEKEMRLRRHRAIATGRLYQLRQESVKNKCLFTVMLSRGNRNIGQIFL